MPVRDILAWKGAVKKFFDLEEAMQKILAGLLFWMILPVFVASAALVDNGDGTVTDNQTGLMWQKATAPGYYTWQEAMAYAEGLSLSGYSDWRLPDRDELESLVDSSRYGPSIDPVLEADTVSSHYWSSTPDTWMADYAWRVNFSFGDAGIGSKLTSCSVRAVRTAQSGSSGDSVISRASYQFEEGDKPTGSVALGDGVTVTFVGNIEVGIVENHLGFYLGSRPAQSLLAPAAVAGEAANLSFTFEEPIEAFAVLAADYDGSTNISAYDSADRLVQTTPVSGSTPATYALTWEQPVAKVVVSGTSGWVGTTDELAVIAGQVVSQLNGSPIQGVTVSIGHRTVRGFRTRAAITRSRGSSRAPIH